MDIRIRSLLRTTQKIWKKGKGEGKTKADVRSSGCLTHCRRLSVISGRGCGGQRVKLAPREDPLPTFPTWHKIWEGASSHSADGGGVWRRERKRVLKWREKYFPLVPFSLNGVPGAQPPLRGQQTKLNATTFQPCQTVIQHEPS